MKLIIYPVIFAVLMMMSSVTWPERIGIHSDIDADGSSQSSGVSLSENLSKRGSPAAVVYGVSLNSIHSDLPLEADNRHYIYPVYFFTNLSFDYFISPFIEFGVDFGDIVWDKVFEGDGKDTDVYYSYGFSLTLKKSIGISVYHKTYDLYFNEFNDPGLRNVILRVTGANLTYYFD